MSHARVRIGLTIFQLIFKKLTKERQRAGGRRQEAGGRR